MRAKRRSPAAGFDPLNRTANLLARCRLAVFLAAPALCPLLCHALPQTIGTNFTAFSMSASGAVRPDTSGDVGPAQILVAGTGRIRVFDHNGAIGGLDETLNNFFNSVRNGDETMQPRVRYDRLSSRWFVTALNSPVSGANRVLIAVSSGPSIAGTNSFSFYQFQQDTGALPAGNTNGFAGWHSLGADRFALYIGADIFNSTNFSFMGSAGFVVNKTNLIGGALGVTAFRFNPSTNFPAFPQGVHNDDPAAAEGYFIGVDSLTFSRLVLRRISDPAGAPTISSNLLVPVPTTDLPLLVPHQGMVLGRRLHALDDRLFAAMLKKNKLTGANSLWTAHSIKVTAGGVGSQFGTRDASRWYEIGNLTSTPSLNQAGTLFDSAGFNPRFFWIPTAAMSGQGHMALGSSVAGENLYASAAVVGRLRTDTAGTLRAYTVAAASTTPYNVLPQDGQPWGAYSQTVVDPNDDMTMWTFQEYCDATNSWGIRVVQLLAPPPATPVSCNPVGTAVGAGTFDIVVTGNSASGSEFFDPGPDTGGPGFSNRISAMINGGGVAVNGVTLNGPTTLTLNITVSNNAAPGARTITITNPDGQAVTSASGIFTIDEFYISSIDLVPAEKIVVNFTTVSGLTYRVLWRDDVVTGVWSTLEDNVPGTGGIVPVSDSDITRPRRFYRVELLP